MYKIYKKRSLSSVFLHFFSLFFNDHFFIYFTKQSQQIMSSNLENSLAGWKQKKHKMMHKTTSLPNNTNFEKIDK